MGEGEEVEATRGAGQLPFGFLQPGQTVVVGESTSLALLAAAEAAAPSGWVAWLGPGRLGLLAARDLGLCWERLVLVDSPSERRSWSAALAAAVDAFEVVVAGCPPRLSTAEARRLSARARESRSVLIVAGGPGWPESPEVRLRLAAGGWEGLGEGHGHLWGRRAVVEASGNGRLCRPLRLALWLPGPDGKARPAAQAVGQGLADPVAAAGTVAS